MNLNEEDIKLFYKLHHSLFDYTNKKFQIIKGINSVEDFKRISFEKLNKLREKLYKEPEIIDSFVSENPFNFSQKELEIIRSWRSHFIKGNFMIFSPSKNCTVFLSSEKPAKAYEVFGLVTPIEEVLPFLPIMAGAVLFPFKGKIIYDGILNSFNVSMGGSIRRGILTDYQKAKSRFGLITSLPFSGNEKDSDEEMLKFYLSNRTNRDEYFREIDEIIVRKPKLFDIYQQEMGRINSREIKNQLKQLGLNGWFAVFENNVVASGKTVKDLEKNVKEILPAEKEKLVHIFQIK